MRYEVTFQVDGEERTEAVEAPDAASAVATIETEHGRTPELFELIQVHLIEEPVAEDARQVSASG